MQVMTERRGGRLTTMRFALVLSVLFAANATARQDPPTGTPVEHVRERKPRVEGGTAARDYEPSALERPFLEGLTEAERLSGAYFVDYDALAESGMNVGWFGIVRIVDEDVQRGETRLVVEHKSFGGTTAPDLLGVDFNGSGDFRVRLRGTGHGIEPLTLVRVYGRAGPKPADDLVGVEARFVRCWYWGTFVFVSASMWQQGSETWRRLNTVPLERIYEPDPDDRYYVDRLGPRRVWEPRATAATLAVELDRETRTTGTVRLDGRRLDIGDELADALLPFGIRMQARRDLTDPFLSTTSLRLVAEPTVSFGRLRDVAAVADRQDLAIRALIFQLRGGPDRVVETQVVSPAFMRGEDVPQLVTTVALESVPGDGETGPAVRYRMGDRTVEPGPDAAAALRAALTEIRGGRSFVAARVAPNDEVPCGAIETVLALLVETGYDQVALHLPVLASQLGAGFSRLFVRFLFGGERPQGETDWIDPYRAEGAAWIAARRAADGGFGAINVPASLLELDDIGRTGMALAALIADFQLDDDALHGAATRGALQWLLGELDDAGQFGRESPSLLSQGWATLAVLEAVSSGGRTDLESAATRALRFCARARARDGGWGLEPGSARWELEATALMLRAFAVADEAGLEVPEGAVDPAVKRILAAVDPETGRVSVLAARRTHGDRSPLQCLLGRHPEAESALAAAALIAAGRVPAEEPKLARLIDRLHGLPAAVGRGPQSVDGLFALYGSWVVSRLGGREWQAWCDTLVEALHEYTQGLGRFRVVIEGTGGTTAESDAPLQGDEAEGVEMRSLLLLALQSLQRFDPTAVPR